MRKRDPRVMQLLALCCLLATAVALSFSQPAREMLMRVNGSPAMHQHLTGRKLLKSVFTAAPTARFDDYDGSANTAVQVREDFWVATGFVEYDTQGSRRRVRWSCLFDARTRGLYATEVGPGVYPSPEFVRQVESILPPRARRLPSTASTIEEAWGWKRP
jgi:hypothetical protein